MKKIIYSSLLITLFFVFSCTSSNVEPTRDGDTFRNQTGLLRWTGSPAVDGTGMLLVVNDVEYGAPGTPENYSPFFNEDQYEVEIRADFKLTGEETVRGWGATFPEIEFIKIKQI